MRILTYVLLVGGAISVMSSTTREAGFSIGNKPGDLAPRIGLLQNEGCLNFKNDSTEYVLLQFWAAYDATSRAENVKLYNEIQKRADSKLKMVSVSFDEFASVYNETVKLDNLSAASTYQEKSGASSPLYKEYGLDAGFKNFLIDKNGVIVATDITPQQLSKII